MLRCSLLVCLGGCSLYFSDPGPSPPPPHPTPVEPDAWNDPNACPKPGTHAEIQVPFDGATNVSQPVVFHYHYEIPNTLDGKAIWLEDTSGQQAMQGAVGDCPVLSTDNSGEQTGPTQNVTASGCFGQLSPDTVYTLKIYITCYDASGLHTIASTTFRTAP